MARSQPARRSRKQASGHPARRAAAGGQGKRQTPAAGARAGGRVLPSAPSFFTPGASPLRRAVERTSAPVLVILHRLPRPVIALLPVVLLAAGLFLPLPVAVVALVLAATLVAWLAYLSWPAVDGRGRALRLVMLALVAIIAVSRLG